MVNKTAIQIATKFSGYINSYRTKLLNQIICPVMPPFGSWVTSWMADISTTTQKCSHIVREHQHHHYHECQIVWLAACPCQIKQQLRLMYISRVALYASNKQSTITIEIETISVTQSTLQTHSYFLILQQRPSQVRPHTTRNTHAQHVFIYQIIHIYSTPDQMGAISKL